jgi:signal transduction histidine kinase
MNDSTEKENEINFLVNQVKRLRSERADLWRQLREKEHSSSVSDPEHIPLEELNYLTNGIVHDIRSGLGIIRNTVGFLQDNLTGSNYQVDLFKISQSVDFCELVLHNLSALGGRVPLMPKWIHLESCIREVYLILERKLVEINLITDFDPDGQRIVADEIQMKQLFMNLMKNAGEAMPDGGTLSFRTRREGLFIRIEISDTGCGISAENQKKLFREFFTTKDKGYGLGLHIINSIVKRHGGSLEVQSKLNQGTTFVLRLPVETD